MTGADDALALAFASGLPFAGLRDHEHDPGLDGVVPPQAAHAARVVLLAVDDGRVRLAAATAQPDLGALTAYLGDRRVELAISEAIRATASREYDAGWDDAMAPEGDGDDERDDMDGDHASALESVYGPDNDGEG